MAALARSLPKDELSDRAHALYEEFRPVVAPGASVAGARRARSIWV